jgi:hypothetical protein
MSTRKRTRGRGLTPTRVVRGIRNAAAGVFGRGPNRGLATDNASIERGLVEQSVPNKVRGATSSTIKKAFAAPVALAKYASDSSKPTAKRIAASIGAPLSIVGSLAPAAIIGSSAVLTGKAIRVGLTEAGAAIGAAKGAIQLPFTTTYGVGKGLYHAPGYVYRKVATGLARRRLTKRTGFNINAITGELDKLESKKAKSQSKLNALIAAQEAKIEKKSAKLTPEQMRSKLEKYDKQRAAIEAKIIKRNANIGTFAEEKLIKERKGKEKYGDYQTFTLATKKDFDGKSAENKAAILRSRMDNKFEQQRLAYNTAITSKITAKRGKLGERIRTQQGKLNSLTSKINQKQDEVDAALRNSNGKKTPDYFRKLYDLRKLESEEKGLRKGLNKNTTRLTRSVDKEEKLLASKGLQAKRDILNKRRQALARSEEGLRSAGKAIVSPITSVYYGAKLGYQVGKTFDNQITKGVVPGKVNAYSNSRKVIGKTFKQFIGTNKKKNYPAPAPKYTGAKQTKELNEGDKARMRTIKNTLTKRVLDLNSTLRSLEAKYQINRNQSLLEQIRKLNQQVIKYDGDIRRITGALDPQQSAPAAPGLVRSASLSAAPTAAPAAGLVRSASLSAAPTAAAPTAGLVRSASLSSAPQAQVSANQSVMNPQTTDRTSFESDA